MPPAVKKGMSVTILTMLSTSIILAILGWFGNTALDARDTKIDVNYVKGQMETLNQSMTEFVAISHENRVEIARHKIQIEYCSDEISRCKDLHEEQ